MKFFSAPVGIRTPNLLIRSQMLYPIELLVQRTPANIIILAKYLQCFITIQDIMIKNPGAIKTVIRRISLK